MILKTEDNHRIYGLIAKIAKEIISVGIGGNFQWKLFWTCFFQGMPIWNCQKESLQRHEIHVNKKCITWLKNFGKGNKSGIRHVWMPKFSPKI
jgi:hypothetical protein